jgi:hypothetical protein
MGWVMNAGSEPAQHGGTRQPDTTVLPARPRRPGDDRGELRQVPQRDTGYLELLERVRDAIRRL